MEWGPKDESREGHGRIAGTIREKTKEYFVAILGSTWGPGAKYGDSVLYPKGTISAFKFGLCPN